MEKNAKFMQTQDLAIKLVYDMSRYTLQSFMMHDEVPIHHFQNMVRGGGPISMSKCCKHHTIPSESKNWTVLQEDFGDAGGWLTQSPQPHELHQLHQLHQLHSHRPLEEPPTVALDPARLAYLRATGVPSDNSSLVALDEIARFLSLYTGYPEKEYREMLTLEDEKLNWIPLHIIRVSHWDLKMILTRILFLNITLLHGKIMSGVATIFHVPDEQEKPWPEGFGHPLACFWNLAIELRHPALSCGVSYGYALFVNTYYESRGIK